MHIAAQIWSGSFWPVGHPSIPSRDEKLTRLESWAYSWAGRINFENNGARGVRGRVYEEYLKL